MIVNIYSVWDEATKAFLQPMYALSKGAIMRGITEACNDVKHDFHKYARDYTLFELGSFDDSNGSFDILPTPRSLGVLVEFINVFRDPNPRGPHSDDVN